MGRSIHLPRLTWLDKHIKAYIVMYTEGGDINAINIHMGGVSNLLVQWS